MSLQDLQAALLPTPFSEPYGSRKTVKQMIRRFADQLVQECAMERQGEIYVVKEQTRE